MHHNTTLGQQIKWGWLLGTSVCMFFFFIFISSAKVDYSLPWILKHYPIRIKTFWSIYCVMQWCCMTWHMMCHFYLNNALGFLLLLSQFQWNNWIWRYWIVKAFIKEKILFLSPVSFDNGLFIKIQWCTFNDNV